MDAMAVAQRMTAQEYLAEPFDEVRSELVEGEVIVEQPDLPHQRVLRAILPTRSRRGRWCRARPRRDHSVPSTC